MAPSHHVGKFLPKTKGFFPLLLQEFSMFEWLKFLPIHTFSPRHFESEDNPKSPLNAAAKRVYQAGIFKKKVV